VMTILGGKIVHASDEFSQDNPPLPPISPEWSPVKYSGTYAQNKTLLQRNSNHLLCKGHQHKIEHHSNFHFGCFCWAF
jgi:hypothetical protein